MHVLEQLIAERIVSGLKRKSVTSCSKWAQNYRVMGQPFPGPWTFRYHPWLKEMHDSKAECNVGQKSAQMGFTETALNITFFKIDVEGIDCLYVLPAKTPDAGDFSAARFDPALELSPHLMNLFSDVKNIGHKRAGTTNLYIRGSKSRSGLKSIPIGFLALDEVDEMDQDNISLARERSSGQMIRQEWALSTPTINNFGINKLFQTSTQEHYFFKCPGCNRMTELIYPDSICIVEEDKIEESYIQCKECKKKLEHKTKSEWLANGTWIPEYTNRDIRGFYINQLYSCTVSPVDFAKAFIRAQHDPSDEQEFYNSKLGLPHIVEGARVTDKQIDDCRSNYKRGSSGHGIITMGVDVGKWLHYEIDEWEMGTSTVDLNVSSKCRVLDYGKVQHFEELDTLLINNNVRACVIDANPERRKAFEFASRFWGHIRLCFYVRGIQGKRIHVGTSDDQMNNELNIMVDRTSWLDLSLGRFRNKTITLPIDITHEYRTHIKALVRIYEKDIDGNPIGKYVKGNEEDHFAHARNYAEIALPLAMSIGQSQNLGSVL